MTSAEIQFLDVGGRRIAYRQRPGRSPTLLFLPGYASDMEGTKAVALDAFAAERDIAMLRFDYSGTGSSGGAFAEGTLDRWIEEALSVADLAQGPITPIGSSMGGWIALHVALRQPDRVAALVGIAAAPDFTEWGFSEEAKARIQAEGRFEEPNPYGPDPQIINRAFWESGKDLLLLDREIPLDCPVRLIHGEEDEDVPIDIAHRTMQRLRSGDVQLLTIKGGGHRLSEPHEIQAILGTVASLLEHSE